MNQGWNHNDVRIDPANQWSDQPPTVPGPSGIRGLVRSARTTRRVVAVAAVGALAMSTGSIAVASALGARGQTPAVVEAGTAEVAVAQADGAGPTQSSSDGVVGGEATAGEPGGATPTTGGAAGNRTPDTTAPETTTAPPATSAVPPTTVVAPTTTPTVPASDPVTAGDLVLLGDGIGPFSIGDDADATIAGLSTALGQPDGDTGWTEGCTIVDGLPAERYVRWGTLQVRFDRDRSGGGPATFAAWTVSEYVGAGGANVTMLRGIGLGTTVEDLAATYPVQTPEYVDLSGTWEGSFEMGDTTITFTTDGGGPAARVTSLSLNAYLCD